MLNISIDTNDYTESVYKTFEKLLDSMFLNYKIDEHNDDVVIRHAKERSASYCEDAPFCEIISHFASLWKPSGTTFKEIWDKIVTCGVLRGKNKDLLVPYEAFLGKVTPLNKEPYYKRKPMPLSVDGNYWYKPSIIFESEYIDYDDEYIPMKDPYVLLCYGEPSMTESGIRLLNWRMNIVDLENTESVARIIKIKIVETQAVILEAIQRNPSIISVTGDVYADGAYIGRQYCEAVHKELIEKVYYEHFDADISCRLMDLKEKLYNWGLLESVTADIVKWA